MSGLRQKLKQVEDRFAIGTSKLLSFARPGNSGQFIPILGYHRVSQEPAGLAAPTWNVNPQQFESQMQGVLDRGFQPWCLNRLLKAYSEQSAIPENAFVVTFDDGYENNFTNAFPVLQRLSIPATIFVVTGFLDSDQSLSADDWAHAGDASVNADTWKGLSSVQCQQMMDSGLITLGCHTHTHRDFRSCPDDFRSDMKQSLHILKDRFGLCDVPFVSPFGATHLGFVNDELVQVASQCGVTCALSFDNRIADLKADPFHWNRLIPLQTDGPSALAIKMRAEYTKVRQSIWNLTKLVRPSRWIPTQTSFD